MLKIKASTKRGQSLIQSTKRWDGVILDDCYNSHSQAKRQAYNYCFNECLKDNGVRFHIISHNTFGFSVAWDILDKNGDVAAIRIETPKNSYLIIVE